MTKSVVVGGFDIASISSGVTYVRGTWDGSEVKFEPILEKAYTIQNTFPSRFEHARAMAIGSRSIRDKYGLDLCAIEDYINSIVSMVSFSMGEFNGIVRAFHFLSGLPILLDKPAIMRSFIANGRPIPPKQAGKRAIVEWCKEDFGFVSQMTYVKERSDCCDAFVHAAIGIYTLMFLDGVPLDILDGKRKLIFRNPKKNGILDNLENRLYRPSKEDQ